MLNKSYLNNLYKLITTILIFGIISTSLESPSVNAQTKETFEVPTEACELSKTYPTIVTKINAEKALTKSILLNNCYVEYSFPSITAGPKHYTPLGRYTVDYSEMKRVAFLTNLAADYKNLRAPNWMPYVMDKSTGDYGEAVSKNLFGLHAAPWRYTTEFYGEKEVLNGGTHGCTNLRISTSNYLYNFMETKKSENKLVKIFNY